MPSAFIPSRLGYSAMLLAEQQINQRPVHPGPLVLRTAPLKYPTPTPDRDRTDSRRSEPSSRTALMGEQPNPWDLLQPQDAMSRHRGAKPLRRCELLGVISLLSQGSFYPLSDGNPTLYHRITKSYFRTCSTRRCRSQAPFCLCTLRMVSDHSEGTFERLRYPFGGDRPSQTPHLTCPPTCLRPLVRNPVQQGWYPNSSSTATGVTASKPPTYPVHAIPNPSIKLE